MHVIFELKMDYVYLYAGAHSNFVIKKKLMLTLKTIKKKTRERKKKKRTHFRLRYQPMYGTIVDSFRSVRTLPNKIHKRQRWQIS